MILNKMLCVILCMTSDCFSFTWSTAVNGILTTKTILPTTNGLGNQLVDSVADSVQMAMLHCRNVFKWDRWNCPESAFARKHADFVTREQAYVSAILNAAIVHDITKRCSRGELAGCGCDPNYNAQSKIENQSVKSIHLHLETKTHERNNRRNNKRRTTIVRKHKRGGAMKSVESGGMADGKQYQQVDWIWGGCSEDVKYGETVAQKLMDNLEKQHKDAQAYARMHNNLAGRLAVRKSMRKRCRCHGVSGSCALQTCWRQMAPFAQIADSLKQRYKNAISVNYEDKFGNSAHVKRNSGTDNDDQRKESPKSLVFVEASPDYCAGSSNLNWPGTKGRQCSRERGSDVSLSEKRSCRNICRNCGFRVKKQVRQVIERCECTFHWCCEVKCKKCTRTVEEYHCN